jgi:hypothetical protein
MQRMSRPEFEGLCRAAVRKNQKSQVSGLLLFSGTEFLQCLEGPDKENVAEIYRSIVLDDRHQDPNPYLKAGPCAVLCYGNPMKMITNAYPIIFWINA